MIPRLDIRFPIKRQWCYWFGRQYEPQDGEYLLNHARTGIVMALKASLPNGGRVGVVAYNCHTVANAVVNAGCTPVFMDVIESLTIDIESMPQDLDAIVVTNLFGIRNDVAAIRARCPKAIIIVDNAHGYGLPAEGDYTVYSINQGKFPALGEGGILKVSPSIGDLRLKIDDLYKSSPKYSFIAQCKLFVSMLVKAFLYQPWLYGWFTMRLKQGRANKADHSPIALRQMAPGIRRLYRSALTKIEGQIAEQRKNAEAMKATLIADFKLQIDDLIVGENAFMLIARTKDPAELQMLFADRGVETATHFAHAIDWAKEFGYVSGTCPMAEQLTKELLMIPTYKQ